MFGIFKRLKALEAENQSLTGILAHELREKYKGKYASYSLFGGYHKINDVKINGGEVQIKIHNEICLWLSLRDCTISDTGPHARTINMFENTEKMLEKLKFDIKLSESSMVRHIHTELERLGKEVYSLKPTKPKSKKK